MNLRFNGNVIKVLVRFALDIPLSPRHTLPLPYIIYIFTVILQRKWLLGNALAVNYVVVVIIVLERFLLCDLQIV